MGYNFRKIKDGDLFTTTDGETFKRTSPLTFENMAGIEQYIDPLFDRKIGAAGEAKPDVDTSAHVVTEPETKTPKKSTKKSKKSKKSD